MPFWEKIKVKKWINYFTHEKHLHEQDGQMHWINYELAWWNFQVGYELVNLKKAWATYRSAAIWGHLCWEECFTNFLGSGLLNHDQYRINSFFIELNVMNCLFIDTKIHHIILTRPGNRPIIMHHWTFFYCCLHQNWCFILTARSGILQFLF